MSTIKKIAIVFLTLAITLSSLLLPISADSTAKQPIPNNKENIICIWEDGSYLISTFTSESVPVKASVIRITGNQAFEYRSSDGDLQWKYVLTGVFDVTLGVAAVCIDSTYSYEIYASGWSLTDHTNSYSGNMAYGTATFKHKILFITTTTRNISAEIGCDKNGIVG